MTDFLYDKYNKRGRCRNKFGNNLRFYFTSVWHRTYMDEDKCLLLFVVLYHAAERSVMRRGVGTFKSGLGFGRAGSGLLFIHGNVCV